MSNNFQTDEFGNLYDENGKFIAEKKDFSIDENGKIKIHKEKPKKSFFDKIEKYFTKFSEKNPEPIIQEESSFTFSQKNLEKFPAEFSMKEDFKNFQKNMKNILNFSKKKSENRLPFYKLLFVKPNDLLDFLDQLSTLVNAGIRLVDGIMIIQKQTKNPGMKNLITEVSENIKNGMQLSESMACYPSFFPMKWIKLSMAAEKSGKLASVLKDLVHEEKKQGKFVSKIKGAMIYPGILMTMALLVFWLMMTKMVPALQKSFDGIDNFPPLTKKIIELSGFITEHYFLILFIPFVFFFILKILKTQFITIEKIFDYIFLRMPVFGEILYRKNIIIFLDNFSLLLSSGILSSDSLKITAQIMPSVLYRKEVYKMYRGVMAGKKISQILGISGSLETASAENFYFSLEIAQMIKIGEETGKTIEILKKIKEINEDKLNNLIKNLTAMLEPLITVVIGIIVGTLLIAFMVPIMSSFKNV